MSKWEKNLKFYDELVARNPHFERLGKTMPYTAANTHMFSLLNKAGELGIRLSKESGEAFKAKHNTTEFKSYGATMRGYVLIPEHLFDNLELLDQTLEEAYQFVMALQPNPRKGKK